MPTFLRIATFLLLAFSLFGALGNTVSGVVLDAETKEPLPYAHVIIGDIRNVTNHDGSFVIKIPENEKSTILVSFIGYHSAERKILEDESFLTIELNPSSIELENVIVTSDFGKQLLDKSTNRLLQNYEVSRLKHRGYYKETLKQRDDLKYIAEGIVDIYVPLDYQRDDLQPLVSPIKTRKKVIGSSSNFEPLTGHAGDMAESSIWRKGSFLDKDYHKFYDFEYGGYEEIQGRGVYIVDFQPNHYKGNTKGRIYIEDRSFAIIKLEYQPLASFGSDWTDAHWVEEYEENNGYYELFRVSFEGTFSSDQVYSSELIIHETETIDALPANVYYDPKAAFVEEASSNFDDSFWENYNFLKLEDSEQLVLNQER